MMEQITFENHRIDITAGRFCSIEKILAVEENYYGPIEVLRQTATTASYRFKTRAGFLAKYKNRK